MLVEPSSQLLPSGSTFQSAGGRFSYTVVGPVCRLYDREELPWPICQLSWRGKAPSWNRQGKRFVADLAAQRCPSYAVIGRDSQGNEWHDVITIYWEKLTPELRHWWNTKKPEAKAFPELPQTALTFSSFSHA